ncbi:MAG: putative DNA polymerase [Prokaryotic dsDNA virus sp.]|jgi:DNA polymerase I-like protein with 3'-5' exonuclease and polymerase domains|nr:MAG: putative DNA polymerase [Prokaryotic dsDNA virus sp.]|tara:strand:- start:2428 stop:4140 length:1713 start_codon:yes stop_codon:yes gene_type:complete
MIIFDIEADHLLPDVTKVHCMVLKNLRTGNVVRIEPDNIQMGLGILQGAKAIGGHNIMAYDLPVLKKLYNFEYKGKVFDTLVASRLIWSNLKEIDLLKRTVDSNLIGSHSLKAWGQRLKFNKGDYGEYEGAFDKYTPEMLDYCEQDVHLNTKFYELIQSKDYPEKPMQLEHEMNRLLLQQERNGFPFDVDKARALYAKLSHRKQEIETELVNNLPPTVVELKTKTKVIPFNPASRQQIADRLQQKGWKPEEFTPSGEPKVDEKILAGIDMPEAKLLTEYLMLNKRLGQLGNGKQAWLKLEREGRIHGRVNHMGAVTSRCTHSDPNVAQVPSIGAAYGKECRALFHATEGFSLLGADASGLELRCLAHYMNRYDGGAYGKEILSGDIHTANQKAAGLETRPQAKTFIYGFLYGAGNEKIGQIIGKGAREGGQIKKRFLAKTPALKKLTEALKYRLEQQSGDKFINGLDGRRIPIRHPHAALNTLLQSAGAIICKKWYATIDKKIRERGYKTNDVSIVAFVHDEVQILVKKGLEDEIGAITKEAIKETELEFNFKCPLDSEYQVGSSWAETH